MLPITRLSPLLPAEDCLNPTTAAHRPPRITTHHAQVPQALPLFPSTSSTSTSLTLPLPPATRRAPQSIFNTPATAPCATSTVIERLGSSLDTLLPTSSSPSSPFLLASSVGLPRRTERDSGDVHQTDGTVRVSSKTLSQAFLPGALSRLAGIAPLAFPLSPPVIDTIRGYGRNTTIDGSSAAKGGTATWVAAGDLRGWLRCALSLLPERSGWKLVAGSDLTEPEDAVLPGEGWLKALFPCNFSRIPSSLSRAR